MASEATLLANLRVLLQDTRPDTVWPEAVLSLFLAEGVRRLHPLCGQRQVATVVAVPGQLEYSLSSAFPDEVVAVEALILETGDVGQWLVYGDTLYLTYAATADFQLRAMTQYGAASDAPGVLADAVLYYAAGKALQWLLNRGGSALSRYLAEQGELATEEVLNTIRFYEEQFYAIRDENATFTTTGA